MSRIDDLIREYCPNGAPHRAVTDLADYVRGITYSKSDEQTDGPVAVLRANNITLSSNTLNFTDVKRVSGAVRVRENQRLVAGDILLCAGSGSRDHIGKAAYVAKDMPGTFGGFMAVLRPKDDVDSRFLFHIMTGGTFSRYLESALSTATINNLNARVMNGFRVPVPPREVQREIVKVLDAFTELEAELGAELGAELDARRLQYGHYRDALLSFPGLTSVPRVAMGDLGRFTRGRRFTKGDMVPDGLPAMHYGEIYTHYGVHARSALSRVRIEMAGQLRFAETGDVVFAAVGETVADVAKAVAWLGREAVAIHDDTFSFRSELNPKYVAYFAQTGDFHAQKDKYVARAKVKRLSGESLGKIVVPVPPMEEQERIVGVLDKFDALVNDLTTGLPAELQARRQQYEYYRDKLLTFDEVAS